MHTPDDGLVGYIVEVDFSFPIELHAKFKAYPPAPESRALDVDWCSELRRDLAEKHGIVKNGKYQGPV